MTARALFAAALVALAACHTVALDAPDARSVRVPSLAGSPRLLVEPASAALVRTVRGTGAGLAHGFDVEVGASLVAYGEAYLDRAFRGGERVEVRVAIEEFGYSGGRPRLVTHFEVHSGGERRFVKRYEVVGAPRADLPGAETAEGPAGVAAPGTPARVREALAGSLHDVLVLTFGAFLEDLAERVQD